MEYDPHYRPRKFSDPPQVPGTPGPYTHFQRTALAAVSRAGQTKSVIAPIPRGEWRILAVAHLTSYNEVFVAARLYGLCKRGNSRIPVRRR
jgi:hypothetical protein